MPLRQTLVALAIFIPSCSGALNQTDVQVTIAGEVYEYVMEAATAYQNTHFSKTLAACIKWPTPGDSTIYVDTYGWSYLDITSDGQLPLNDLKELALSNCNSGRAEHSFNCKCQMLDIGDNNVLEVPNDIVRDDYIIRSRVPKEKPVI